MKHEGKTFSKERVFLDGNEFHKCTFDGAELVYEGGDPPSFVRCSFNDFKLSFEGAAGRTMAFIKAMANPNSGLQQIVRDTFPFFRTH